jgi:putative hemin transport protein
MNTLESLESLSMQPNPPLSATDLRAAWARLRSENPGLRIRDAAKRLQVSELELLALECGRTATRLSGDWGGLVLSLPALGPVMALTRNEHAVHELNGRYAGVSVVGLLALLSNDEIDLKLLMRKFRFAFAVTETSHGHERRSLQFFDPEGSALHKVFLLKSSELDAYEALLERYAAEDQSPGQALDSALTNTTNPMAAPAAAVNPDPAAPFPGDTSEAMAMGRWLGIERLHPLAAVNREAVRPVSAGSAEVILRAAAAQGLPLSIWVASPGAIQRYQGQVKEIQRTGPWINVLDPGFSLHLRDTAAASSWVVRGPGSEENAASVELFDERGQPIIRLSSVPEAGSADVWENLVKNLEAVAESPAREGV